MCEGLSVWNSRVIRVRLVALGTAAVSRDKTAGRTGGSGVFCFLSRPPDSLPKLGQGSWGWGVGDRQSEAALPDPAWRDGAVTVLYLLPGYLGACARGGASGCATAAVSPPPTPQVWVWEEVWCGAAHLAIRCWEGEACVCPLVAGDSGQRAFGLGVQGVGQVGSGAKPCLSLAGMWWSVPYLGADRCQATEACVSAWVGQFVLGWVGSGSSGWGAAVRGVGERDGDYLEEG